MVGWRHRLNGHEFEQIPEASEGLGSLAGCSPWDCRVGHDLATEQQPHCRRTLYPLNHQGSLTDGQTDINSTYTTPPGRTLLSLVRFNFHHCLNYIFFKLVAD